MSVVKYKKFDNTKELFLPSYQTDGASGMDLMSIENVIIDPGITYAVSTNLSVEIPTGYLIYVTPRSGLAIKNSITILNSPGLIDEDYRGEIKVILHNAGKLPFSIKKGDRIAQMTLFKYEKIELFESNELSNTKRGIGGFGSTGIK